MSFYSAFSDVKGDDVDFAMAANLPGYVYGGYSVLLRDTIKTTSNLDIISTGLVVSPTVL